MEKGLICIILLVLVIFSSCKKETTKPPGEEYIEGWTEVLGIKGTDTSSTGQMNARTQALAVDEDTQLKAELISYLALPGGQGQYKILVTNKTDCQMILRWQWEGLRLFDGIPDDDVIQPGATTEYTWIGTAEPGKIYVKSEQSNSTCHPSRQLKLEITTVILPIKYTNKSTKRVGDQMIVEWSTDSPGDVDQFLVMWSPTGKKEEQVCKYILASDPNKKAYSIKFPAVKKTIK